MGIHLYPCACNLWILKHMWTHPHMDPPTQTCTSNPHIHTFRHSSTQHTYAHKHVKTFKYKGIFMFIHPPTYIQQLNVNSFCPMSIYRYVCRLHLVNVGFTFQCKLKHLGSMLWWICSCIKGPLLFSCHLKKYTVCFDTSFSLRSWELSQLMGINGECIEAILK